MAKDVLSEVIASRLAAVAPLAEKVRGTCLALGMNRGAAGEVELAVVEAVNNSIEHAYQLADGGEVQVVINCDGAVLQIEVYDRGRPMPATALATAEAPDVDVARDNLPEGGMGLYLVQRLMDRVSYESRAGRNVLRMERQLDRATS